MVPGRENRIYIGIYGRCNVGKSTLLNYLANSDIALVSPVGGTTTDPQRRSYEITGFAPVVFIDTAGLDDKSPLGELRVQRTMETVSQIDLAVVVYSDWGEVEQTFVGQLQKLGVPVVRVQNGGTAGGFPAREEIFEKIKSAIPSGALVAPRMFGGIVSKGETVLLVCPIDSAAPAGRLILPQVQAIRELLDIGAIAIAVQPEEVAQIFEGGPRPRLVVSDSQVMAEVEMMIPRGVQLTSFSILLAAAKGDKELYEKGLEKVDLLREGEKVLIVENCLHQSSCDDIGRVKIPRWLDQYTGKRLDYSFVSGLAPLPADLETYALMVQCGGCMVSTSQLRNRIRSAAEAAVAVTNYGMLIRKIRRI